MKKFLNLVLLFTSFATAAQAAEVKFEHDSAVPIVYLNIAVKGGAAHDPKGQSGISNFMGEMLLRGTKRLNRADLNLAIDQLGAKIEVETRSESLILKTAVVSSKLPEFMDLVKEIITTPRFSEAEIGKLKTEVVSVILEERGQDQSLARKRWEAFLFEGHPYGNPIMGKLHDVERLNHEAVVAQYKRFFQKPNLVVVGSGDADESFVKGWADRLTDALLNGAGAIEKVSPPPQSQKFRVRIIDKPERTQTQMYVGQVGVRMDDPSFFPLYVGNHVLGGGSFSARLMTEIRVKKGWAYGAYSYFRHGLRPRSWAAFTFPATKDTPDALALLISLLKDMKERGITPAEFQFAKDSLVNSAGFMFNTPKKRAENILVERTLELPDGIMKSYGPRIASTSLEEVNQSWKNFLKPDQFLVLILGTAKDLTPRIAKTLNIPESEIEIVPYTKE